MTREPGSTGSIGLAARAVWWGSAVLAVVLFVVALPARYEQLLTDPYHLEPGLRALGLTVGHFALYGMTLDLLTALALVLCAFVLFVRRPDDRMVWLVSLSIVMMLITILPVVTVWNEENPLTALLLRCFRAWGFALLLAAFLLFPDGKVAPRISLAIGALGFLYAAGWVLVPHWAPPTAFTDLRNPEDGLRSLPLLFFFVAIVAVQLYRYRRLYNRVQRQQTLWVVMAVLAVLGIMVMLVAPLFWAPALANGSDGFTLYLLLAIPITLLAFLLFPLSVVVAVARYRLWEIDYLVRRTLQYTLLTGLLLLLYAGAIVLLQILMGLLSGQTSSPLVIVLSTLVIAALINPLRRQVQQFVDRRFYRQKYDAQQVLARFAVTVRDETDLDSLTAALARVVGETMQPEGIRVWLAKVEGNR